LTELIDPATHEMMKEGFETWSKVWEVEKYGKTADEFRELIGFVEVIAGILLALPAIYAILWPISFYIAPLLLTGIMAGAAYTHIIAKDMPPVAPLVLGGLLLALIALNLAAALTSSSAPKEKSE